MFSLSLLLLLTAHPLPQAPADAAQAIAPFVGEEVGLVLHADLSRIDFAATAKRLAGPFADAKDFQQGIAVATGVIDSLKKAGARDAFVLLDPNVADAPNVPLIIFTVTPGSDPKPLRDVLAGLLPGGGPNGAEVAVVGSTVIAGSPAVVAQAKATKNPARSDLTAAFAAAGDTPAQVLFVPSPTQRRAFEEAMPSLPPQLGGAPITTLTRGMKWGVLALTTEPDPSLKMLVQASDEAAARSLQAFVGDFKKLMIEQMKSQPQLAAMVPSLEKIALQQKGDQVIMEMSPRLLGDMLIPPIQAAREAARRSQCVNNLKQIALAMHNYVSTHGDRFPGSYNAGPNGKLLLSWRVHILPFLDQEALYKQFHLDEPWDSEHNKALIGQMPRTYACPSANPELVSQGKTCYLVPRGKDTIFPGAQGLKIQEITDGTSNTILVAEAGDGAAVTWTKPDDWDVTGNPDWAPLKGHHPNGTNMAFADGSVRFLSFAIDLGTLKKVLTAAGGEVIGQEEFAR